MEMEPLYKAIIGHLRDGVYFVDTERRIHFWNHAAEVITGYPAEEVVGKRCQDTQLNYIDEDGRPLCTIGCPLFATIIDGLQRQLRVFVRHKNGHRVPLLITTFPMEQDGRTIGAIEIFTQASPIVYADNLVEHLSGIAMHDELTQLPNRRYMESFLSYKLTEFKRFGNPCAVIFADIDNFGRFNNDFGHEVGDQVLTHIAESIIRHTRKGDMVGRWGGEEFVGIFSITQAQEAPALAEKFRRLVSQTEVPYRGLSLHVSISVGVTIVQLTDTESSVVKRADDLMYQSKQAGKDRVTVG